MKNNLIEIFSQNPAISLLRDNLCNGGSEKHSIYLKGLHASAKSFALASLLEQEGGRTHLVIMQDRDEASRICNDLYNLYNKEEIFFFPAVKSQYSKIENPPILTDEECIQLGLSESNDNVHTFLGDFAIFFNNDLPIIHFGFTPFTVFGHPAPDSFMPGSSSLRLLI